MESLQIRTGQVSLNILDDAGNSRGVFTFNPTDIESAKRLVQMQQEFAVKQNEFNEKASTCETQEEKVNLLSEVVNYFRNVVDECFGEGSSQTLFGEARTLSMFEDFFNGIIPYYEQAKKQRMQKYTKKNAGK